MASQSAGGDVRAKPTTTRNRGGGSRFFRYAKSLLVTKDFKSMLSSVLRFVNLHTSHDLDLKESIISLEAEVFQLLSILSFFLFKF